MIVIAKPLGDRDDAARQANVFPGGYTHPERQAAAEVPAPTTVRREPRRERNDDWVVELLGRDTVLDLHERGAGPQEAAKFRRAIQSHAGALPIVVTTNNGRCLSLLVEVPKA